MLYQCRYRLPQRCANVLHLNVAEYHDPCIQPGWWDRPDKVIQSRTRSKHHVNISHHLSQPLRLISPVSAGRIGHLQISWVWSITIKAFISLVFRWKWLKGGPARWISVLHTCEWLCRPRVISHYVIWDVTQGRWSFCSTIVCLYGYMACYLK